MAAIKQQVKDIDSTLHQHTIEQRQDFDLVFKKLDNLGTKFAGKWVEKVTITIFASVGAAIIVGLVYII